MPAHPPRSPASTLLLGLVLTLAIVVAFAGYIVWQVAALRALQSNLADRHRQESLHLLRIQDDLNQLALAMRDMLDGEGPYPLTAWASQFERIRADLDAALARQAQVAVAGRTPEESTYLAESVSQFWDAAGRIFALAAAGREDEARAQIQLSLQARQASLSTAVARLLVQNNASEERTAQQVQAIYDRVQGRVYIFLALTLAAVAATGLYLIRSNRQVFAQVAALAEERRDLARQLLTARESTLREIARELHDEFGQLLTAMGSMLTRAARHTPEGSPLRGELREITEIAQSALDNVRGLSQALHPSVLEELGLESAIDAYLAGVERQLGLHVTYERTGTPAAIDPSVGIHVYRVLQEALTNVARHSGAREACVRLVCEAGALELSVEDQGRGIPVDAGPSVVAAGRPRATTGMASMRERAALAGGTLDVEPGPSGGTRVRLRIPLTSEASLSRESSPTSHPESPHAHHGPAR